MKTLPNDASVNSETRITLSSEICDSLGSCMSPGATQKPLRGREHRVNRKTTGFVHEGVSSKLAKIPE
jgi:hypothetical protein